MGVTLSLSKCSAQRPCPPMFRQAQHDSALSIFLILLINLNRIFSYNKTTFEKHSAELKYLHLQFITKDSADR